MLKYESCVLELLDTRKGLFKTNKIEPGETSILRLFRNVVKNLSRYSLYSLLYFLKLYILCGKVGFKSNST